MANTKVTSGVIKDDAVGADQLASNSVVTASINDNAITTAKIADDAILTAKISNSAITNAKMSSNSVDSDQYVDGSIDTAHIGDGQVTSAKLDTNIAVSGTLTVGSHLSLGDSDELRIGAGNDLVLKHTGSNTVIHNTTGQLRIRADNLAIQSYTNENSYINATEGGAVELYYANAKKLETASGGVSVTGTLTPSGVLTANAGVVVDNITIDGTEIDLSSGSLTLDVASETIIDSGSSGILRLKHAATDYGMFFHDSNHMYIQSNISDGDMIFRGNDGGSTIVALTLDMSAAGQAIFNSGIEFGGGLTSPSSSNINIFSGSAINLGTSASTRLHIDTSGNIGFNTTNLAIGSSGGTTGNSTATPNRLMFNNNYSNGYTDASLKLYLFNENATRQGFTSGPAFDLQYHSSGSDAGRHAFHVANTEIFRINKTQVGVGDPSQIANNTTTTFAVRKDNQGGRGGEISIVNYVANAVGNEAALNFGLESSTYHNNDGNAQIKARVMGSSAQTSMIFSNWRGSSFNEAMRINENGTLMVGTSTNATYVHKAHFSGNANIDGIVRIEDVDTTVALSNAVLGLAFSGDNDATNGYFVYMTDGNGAIGSISVASGTSVSFNTTSDERLKKNIVDASSQLDTIKNIKVREFDWKKNDYHELGVIAQEIKSIVPNAVTEGGDDETERPFGVDYGKIVPYLIKAVQEQQEQIDELKAKLEDK